MRIRTIKPEYWTHRMHRTLSEPAALLALALLNLADDEGRFEADPSHIAAMLFPRRPLTKPADECLRELVEAKFITLYKAPVDEQEAEIGMVLNFRKHQVINKPVKSNLPGPPKTAEKAAETTPLPDNYRSATVGLREDYGSPTITVKTLSSDNYGSTPATEETPSTESYRNATVGLPWEGRKEGKGKEGKERKEGGDLPAHFPEIEVPSEKEVLEECAMRGVAPTLGAKFWRHYSTKKNGWQDIAPGQWRLRLWDWHVREAEQPTKAGGGKAIPTSPELQDIESQLQWQRDPEQVERLKKRRGELTGKP